MYNVDSYLYLESDWRCPRMSTASKSNTLEYWNREGVLNWFLTNLNCRVPDSENSVIGKDMYSINLTSIDYNKYLQTYVNS